MSRLALLLPAVLLVLLAGALLGGGLVARHYRPQLEEALGQLTASRVASGQFEALLDEQQRALAAVRASAERRAKDVEQALGEARAQAAEQYAAAVRLLQNPTLVWTARRQVRRSTGSWDYDSSPAGALSAFRGLRSLADDTSPRARRGSPRSALPCT